MEPLSFALGFITGVVSTVLIGFWLIKRKLQDFMLGGDIPDEELGLDEVEIEE